MAGAALLLAGCGSPTPPPFQATDITGADFGKELRLTGHDGKARTLADFRGKAVVLFFGFAHCPDVCPTTLSKLGAVMKSLGADGAKVQVVLVTVDPARDTPEILRQYVAAFDPSFLGLTGSADDIARTTKEFRVIAEKQPGASPDTYTVDHSSGLYVFDPQGRIRLFIPGNQAATAIAQDLKRLIDGA
ncbi:MAG: SCO family protein [Burkholderiales bacterium]